MMEVLNEGSVPIHGQRQLPDKLMGMGRTMMDDGDYYGTTTDYRNEYGVDERPRGRLRSDSRMETFAEQSHAPPSPPPSASLNGNTTNGLNDDNNKSENGNDTGDGDGNDMKNHNNSDRHLNNNDNTNNISPKRRQRGTSSGVAPPPYWGHHRNASRASQASSIDQCPAITLVDHTEDPNSDTSRGLWAKNVQIPDYVIVNGGANGFSGVGAYVVWNCSVQMMDVCIYWGPCG